MSIGMDNPYGNDFYTVSDDEGNDIVLEHLDTIEDDGTYYLAFLPADMDEDDEDYGLVILKAVEENGESVLATVDDEAKLEELLEQFAGRLYDGDDGDNVPLQ